MDETTDSSSPDAADNPAPHPPLPTKRSAATSCKTYRTLKPLAAILLCAISLAISSIFVSTSVESLHLSTVDALDQAQWDYNAALDVTIREEQTRKQLETLLETQLNKYFWEVDYEDCLARGLNTADVHFLGRDYTDYEIVRNKTLDWVKTNCDRIYFTPDAVKPTPVGKIEVWHRRLLERSQKVMGYVKNWLAEVPHGNWKSAWSIKSGCRTPSPTTAPAPYSKHVYLPKGFRLVDCDTPPCQLTYTAPANTTVTHTPKEALEAAYDRLCEKEYVLRTILKVATPLWYFTLAALGVEVVLLGGIGCANILVRYWYDWNDWDGDIKSLRKDIEIACGIQIGTVLTLGALFMFEVGRYLTMELPFALGVIGLVSFLVPNDFVPSTRLLVAAVKELAAIPYGALIPADEKVASNPVPAVPRITPDTTLREDVNVTLEALRAGILDEMPGEEAIEDNPVRVEAIKDKPVSGTTIEDNTEWTGEEPEERALLDSSSSSSSPSSDWTLVDKEWPA